jgi:hypothetical protein
MNTEIKSVITVEVSLNKKMNLCSGIVVISDESLKFVQNLIVPTYLESLNIDPSKFDISSKVIEVTNENDEIIIPKNTDLDWRYEESSDKKFLSTTKLNIQ